MSGQAKDLRKQIRNVLQEVGKELVTSEVGETLEKRLLDAMNARLDQIDRYCQNAIATQDKRARGIQTFLLQEVTGKIQNDLFNANVTVEAVVEVLAEAGLNIPDFANKIDSKKIQIAERLKNQADDKLKAEMEAHAAKENQPKEEVAPAAPTEEAPVST